MSTEQPQAPAGPWGLPLPRARGRPPEASPALAADRLGGLDALRCVAASLVVLSHLHYHGGNPDLGPLNPVAAAGQTGVPLFFALSGYLLYRPFARGRPRLRSYFLRRLLRVYPAYLVALITLAMLSRQTSEDLFTLATFGQQIDRDRIGNVAVAWTLRIELTFYLLLPLIAAVLGGSLLRRLLGVAIISLVPLAAAEFVAGEIVMIAPLWVFAPGMVVAIVEDRVGRPLPLLAAGVLLVVVGIAQNGHPVMDVATLAGGGLLVAGLVSWRPGLPSWVAFAAGMSYAVYLWHYDIIRLVFAAGVRDAPLVVLSLGVTGAIAAASWVLIERPAIAAAHRIETVAPRLVGVLMPAASVGPPWRRRDPGGSPSTRVDQLRQQLVPAGDAILRE